MGEALDEALTVELLRGTVPGDAPQQTVGAWLSREWALSSSLVRRLKQVGGIQVNGTLRRTVDGLNPGDEVVVAMPPEPAPNVAPEPMSLCICYEDRDMVVLDKPPGVVVHPTHGVYTGTLANGLAHHWLSNGERCGIHPVHRIDRNTSGLVLFAKHALAHQRLSAALNANKLERAYQALVWGSPDAEQGMVEAPIALRGDHPVARAVRAGGQPAKTEWLVTQRLAGVTLLRLHLHTGRTHQIRVHMMHIGHPLLGDTLYGANDHDEQPSHAPRQMLHAATLAFGHPRDGRLLHFAAPLPADFQAVLDARRP